MCAEVNRMARNLNVGRKGYVAGARHHVNHSDCRCFWVFRVWVIALPRALWCVSMRSLIGLHVRVPKRNTDFIYPLSTQADPTGRRTRRVESWRRPDSLMQIARLRSRKSKLRNRPADWSLIVKSNRVKHVAHICKIKCYRWCCVARVSVTALRKIIESGVISLR